MIALHLSGAQVGILIVVAAVIVYDVVALWFIHRWDSGR